MRQVWITRRGGPECLVPRDAEDPEPAPGEVRIRVAAAGVNFADILGRMGLYPDAPRGAYVPGYEVSGRIDACGRDVDRRVGERVLALTKFGGYSDVVCVPTDSAHELPSGMSFDTAAALPVQYLTAYHMIVVLGNLRADEVLFVHGIGGGVGLAALQIGRWIGATVIGTASPGKHESIRQHGAARVFGYGESDLAGAVRRETEGGAHVVLDPVGGRSLKTSYRMLAPTGRLFAYGVSSLAPGKRRRMLGALLELARTPRFSPLHMMQANRTVGGVNLGRLWGARHLLQREMRELLELWSNGHVDPVLAARFPLERAADAHAFVQERKNVGKVLLTT